MNLKNRCYIVAVCEKKSIGLDLEQLNFHVIKNGWNYWVADPFPVEVNGELFVFGEMFEYKSLKGAICYTKLTNNGFTKWKKIIEEPFHLSFPYIFQIENHFYMCPESQEGNVLQLYKCVSFPEVWEKDRVIINDTKIVDTIFLTVEDSVYGFTCKWNGINNHEMAVFKVDSSEVVFSNKKLHNVGDCCSRPAGKIFILDDRKIMVSQICKPKYGSGLMFKEFELSFPNYSEKEILRIYPSQVRCNIHKKWDGIHTFNTSENYTVIDMIWSRFSFIEKVYRLINKLNRKSNK